MSEKTETEAPIRGTTTTDPELAAMSRIVKEMAPISKEGRVRILSYLADRDGMTLVRSTGDMPF
jgi:hypothetical protein